MTSYVKFELAEKKPKTEVYNVLSKAEGNLLGRIFWYWAWRQYVFEPNQNTIWSRGCQSEVTAFLNELMEQRKEKQKHE